MSALALAVALAFGAANSAPLALQVGEWVAYRVYGGHDSRTSYWRFAVVGEERDEAGHALQWLEVEFGQHPSFEAPLLQMKVLLSAPPSRRVVRAFLGWGMEPVRELTPSAIEKLFEASERPRRARRSRTRAPLPDVDVKRLPPRALMTRAGTVTASPTEVVARGTVVKRIWISNEIPFLQLARMELPTIDHQIDVAGFGRDARPRIAVPPPEVPSITIEPGAVPLSVLAPVFDGLEEARAPDGP